MPDDQEYDYAKDIGPLGGNILADITQLASEQLEAQQRVEQAEEALSFAKAQLKDIAERRFPDLMALAGQKKLTTSTGLEVTVNEAVRASIPDANEESAFKWLEENMLGSIIKLEMKAEFGKGDEGHARLVRVAKLLEEIKVVYTAGKNVHNGQLCSNIKKLIEAGIDVPMDLFGAFVQKQTKVKPVKK